MREYYTQKEDDFQMVIYKYSYICVICLKENVRFSSAAFCVHDLDCFKLGSTDINF